MILFARRLLTAFFPSLLLGLVAVASPGCGTLQGFAIHALVGEAELPPSQIRRDLVYGPEDPTQPGKNTLDLYLPTAKQGWPTLVFVHGGGWTSGDKAMRVGNFAVYSNIGRFYAARGFGVAVINYRLQPGVTWRDQVLDVARAVAWVQAEIAHFGGDPHKVFLSGHSAGAQLATFVSLVEWPLRQASGHRDTLCGVIPVSGAGFDLADARTYELGAERPYYAERFATDQPDGIWQEQASVVQQMSAPDLPILIFYSLAEWPSLQHQNRLLAERLHRAGGVARRVEIAGLSHARMALAISDPNSAVSRHWLDFLHSTPCQ